MHKAAISFLLLEARSHLELSKYQGKAGDRPVKHHLLHLRQTHSSSSIFRQKQESVQRATSRLKSSWFLICHLLFLMEAPDFSHSFKWHSLQPLATKSRADRTCQLQCEPARGQQQDCCSFRTVST